MEDHLGLVNLCGDLLLLGAVSPSLGCHGPSVSFILWMGPYELSLVPTSMATGVVSMLLQKTILLRVYGWICSFLSRGDDWPAGIPDLWPCEPLWPFFHTFSWAFGIDVVWQTYQLLLRTPVIYSLRFENIWENSISLISSINNQKNRRAVRDLWG